MRGDVETLGAQPAEPRRGDRVVRDGPDKGDGLRVVGPSRHRGTPRGDPRGVLDSVVPGPISEVAVVVVATVDVAEHAPDRERRRTGSPPRRLVVKVVVVIFRRRRHVGEEGGAVGAEVEPPRGGPPAPCATAVSRRRLGVPISPPTSAPARARSPSDAATMSSLFASSLIPKTPSPSPFARR